MTIDRPTMSMRSPVPKRRSRRQQPKPSEAPPEKPRLPKVKEFVSLRIYFRETSSSSNRTNGAGSRPMEKLRFERADYSVVVKNRAPPPKSWRWEIYRSGNASQIKQSSIYFETVSAARQAGKKALKELIDKLFV